LVSPAVSVWGAKNKNPRPVVPAGVFQGCVGIGLCLYLLLALAGTHGTVTLTTRTTAETTQTNRTSASETIAAAMEVSEAIRSVDNMVSGKKKKPEFPLKTKLT
jgi:hypothetical protein